MIATIGAIIAVIVSIVTLVVQLLSVGIYIGKLEGFKELVNFRFEEQDKKLNKHNNIVERTYIAEREISVLKEQLKVGNHRIEDLEGIIK